jgi:poly-gamma-glutamate synthesis protein (capsule biosynthesis protein)
VADRVDKNLSQVRKAMSPMDRRTVLGKGAALVGSLFAAQTLAPAQAASKDKAAASPADRSFTLCVVGEAMVTRPFSMHTEPEFLGIVKLLRDADLSYGHLEMNLANDDELVWAMRGSSGGAGYLVGTPQIAEDLKWAGIRVMSVAQNHSLDWGPQGMLATIKHCNAAGIAVAGTGHNLEEARSPTFLETDKGRMALVSIASGNSAFEWAGLPKGKTPGRPGVNPLRVRTVYQVPHATAEQLKAAGKGLGVLSDRAAARKEFNITPGAISGSNGYSGFTFVDGDKFEITTEGHPADIAGNLRSIDEAAKMADFVMVAQHNSTSEGGRGTTPSTFVVDFARKAIDAGADIYLGHGWHTALGIEIYKGKPILYGLGSFFWQSQYIDRVPADEYESYNQDMDQLTKLNPAVGGLHPEGNSDWGWSAVYQLKFVSGRIAEIRLYPIEMGYDYTGDKPRVNRQIGSGELKYLDGSPRLATRANGQKILELTAKVCALRGTQVEIKDNVGIIKVI